MSICPHKDLKIETTEGGEFAIAATCQDCGATKHYGETTVESILSSNWRSDESGYDSKTADDVIQAIKQYYDGEIDEGTYLNVLHCTSKAELIDFIEMMQSRGCFGRGIIHD